MCPGQVGLCSVFTHYHSLLKSLTLFLPFKIVLVHFSECAATAVPVQDQQPTEEVLLSALVSPQALLGLKRDSISIFSRRDSVSSWEDAKTLRVHQFFFLNMPICCTSELVRHSKSFKACFHSS